MRSVRETFGTEVLVITGLAIGEIVVIKELTRRETLLTVLTAEAEVMPGWKSMLNRKRQSGTMKNNVKKQYNSDKKI
jgi:hypothetical protein